ncbi:hypothetical protein [Streptomyces sp. NPDC005486]|uniref:hypothetical protein n=1 Tax=Streptomyces sp. NPDC005486 TaxID=3155345 RepID=UPI0033A54FEB
MNATANNPWAAFLRFAGPRRPFVALGIAFALGLITSAIGGHLIPMPLLSPGTTAPPMWRFFVLGPAVVSVTALYSPIESLEQVASSTFHAQQKIFLVLVTFSSCACFVASVSLAFPSAMTAIMIRDFFGWLGIALAAGRMFGWRVCWILPVLVLVPMLYWGTADIDGNFPWWEFTARPIEDIGAAAGNVALCLLGTLIYSLTPWRISSARRLFKKPDFRNVQDT